MKVKLLNIYQSAPNTMNGKAAEGLQADMAAAITAASDGYFKLEIEPSYKGRAEKMVRSGEVIALNFTNSLWYTSDLRQKFKWQTPIGVSFSYIVSSKANSIEFQGADSFKGKSVGGLRSYFYKDLDQMVVLGESRRINAETINSLLHMTLRGRFDFALVGNLSTHYLAKKLGMEDKLHISKKIHEAKPIYMLIANAPDDLFEAVDRAVIKIVSNGTAEKIYQKYDISMNEYVSKYLKKSM